MRDYSSSQYENRPLQGSVVDLVTQNEQINAGRRAEKLEKEKFQYLKDSRERDWREKFLKENLKQQDFIDINDVDLNNLHSKTVSKAMDNIGKLSMKIAYGEGTPEDRVKLHLLNQTSDRLKALSAPIGEVIKGLNDGSLHNDPDLRTYLKNLGSAEIDFNDKGEIELVIPTADGSQRVSYNDAMKGIDGFKLTPRVDVFKGTDEIAKGIQAVQKTTYNGYEDVTTKSIDPDYARNQIQAYLYGAPGGTSLSNGAKSWLLDQGFDYRNPNEEMLTALKGLEDTLTERVLNSKERLDETKLDRSSRRGDAALAETRRHNRVTEGISQQNANTSAFNAQTSRMKESGAEIGELTKADNTPMAKAVKSFGALKDYRSVTGKLEPGTLKDSKGKVYEDPVVLGYTYDKKTNSLILDIEYNEATERMDEEGNVIRGKKNRTAIKVGKSTEGRVASLLGGTTEDLRNTIISEQQKTDDPLGIL
ncbi:MAG TPA: hypothetical protein VKX40_08240 [Aequorivita sp.]|nr:hypothetical protein [Aequorivita sp.]